MGPQPLVAAPRLEHAVNLARWAGVALAVGLSPPYPHLGVPWVVALVVLIAGTAFVVPRLVSPPLGHAADIALGVPASFVYSPDPQRTTLFLPVFVIIT